MEKLPLIPVNADQDLSGTTGHVCQSNLSENKGGNTQGMVVSVQDHKKYLGKTVFSET